MELGDQPAAVRTSFRVCTLGVAKLMLEEYCQAEQWRCERVTTNMIEVVGTDTASHDGDDDRRGGRTTARQSANDSAVVSALLNLLTAPFVAGEPPLRGRS